LNRLLRQLTQDPAAALRFRPEVEHLEAREVPSVVPIVTPPTISLTKSAPDVCYAPGSQVTYTYVVGNTAGTNPVTHVSLTDDNGTPANPNDDFTLTPGTNVTAIDDGGTPGDTSDDGVVAAGASLDIGHSWTFQHSVTIDPTISANTTITNVAVVTGTAGDTMVSATASKTISVCVTTPPTTPPTPLAHGDTATIGFWNNKNGQALIKSLNTGPSSTALATWLATNFPHLYGADAGANNLTGKTNTDVAALFQKFFNVKGAKTDAQVLGAALAVYVTDSDLAGTAATKYGFTVTSGGTGDKTYNVGSLGTAIGLQNNTTYTVLQLLRQADLDKANGTFNANAFNSIFDGINQKGDI
jgi:hypothetical protein